MKKMLIALAAAFAVAVLTSGAAVAPLVVEGHDYDGIGTGDIGTKYGNYRYSGGTQVLCRPNYNYIGFPPTSGGCIAANLGGKVEITEIFGGVLGGPSLFGFTGFATDIASGGFGSVTIKGYGPPGVQLTSPLAQTTCSSNYGQTTRCSISSLAAFVRVELEGPAGAWGFDSTLFSFY